MKLSRPAAVFAAVVTLAGGAAVAVNATTGTDAVTLCSSAKTGAVTLPNSSGACAKGTTAFTVASDAAVQALEAQNATQAQAIQALQRRSDSLEGQISVTGQPGDPLGHYWTITA